MLSSPKVILNELYATSCGSPIATNTCDGLFEPVVHAEPLEAHIPYWSKFNNNASPSIFWNEKFVFPGNLFVLSPFNFTFEILF